MAKVVAKFTFAEDLLTEINNKHDGWSRVEVDGGYDDLKRRLAPADAFDGYNRAVVIGLQDKTGAVSPIFMATARSRWHSVNSAVIRIANALDGGVEIAGKDVVHALDVCGETAVSSSMRPVDMRYSLIALHHALWILQTPAGPVGEKRMISALRSELEKGFPGQSEKMVSEIA